MARNLQEDILYAITMPIKYMVQQLLYAITIPTNSTDPTEYGILIAVDISNKIYANRYGILIAICNNRTNNCINLIR